MAKTAGNGASAAPPAEEIPELDDRERRFVELVMQGKTASEAYREAFSVHHWANTAVWTEAGKLRRSPSVRLWIDQARELGLAAAGCTYEDHLNELQRLKTLALRAENFGAAVQAEKIRGEVAGHKTERVQLVPASPEETLNEIAQLSPEMALQLAKDEGIDWQPPGTAKGSKALN